MKYASTTFCCDVRGCGEQITVLEEAAVDAYLTLLEAGWKVIRRDPFEWQQICTTHERGDLQ